LNTKITLITNRLASVLAGSIILVFPAAYFGLSYQYHAAIAQTEAKVGAERVSHLISASPDLWQFQEHRLDVLLTTDVATTVPELRRIVDADGRVVTQSKNEIALPTLTRSAALRDSGREVGRFEVARSLRSVLLGTVTAGIVGLFLGAAILLTLRFFPLRALKHALDTLSNEKERALVTLHSIADAVITIDATGHIDYLNPAAEALTGWSLTEAHGLPISQVFSILHEASGQPTDNPAMTALSTGAIVPLDEQKLLVQRDERRVPIKHTAAPIRDLANRITGAVLVFHDVSESREMATQLSYQASHDDLTGLYNRREFELRIKQALADIHISGTSHVLCYMDLDQFKIINDSCGHTAGDELLRQLTALLRAKVRTRDILARLGGDEFGLLLEGCRLEQAERIVQTLLEVTRSFRFTWDKKAYSIGMSIGLVRLDHETSGLAEVMRAADSACYAAKENGRNRAHVYGPDDAEMLMRRGEMQWVSRLTSAINENRLRLHGQIISPVAADAGDGLMVEILVRLIDESGQMVMPGAFIPAAERYNLMPAIDRWVINATFASMSEFCRGTSRLDTCFINLSGLSWHDEGLVEYVLSQADHYGLSPNVVCFEITETTAIANLVKTTSFIQRLAGRGFRFALDDFGSGMSSFGYLKQLPVNFLKIDGGFVRNMVADKIDHAMVKTINEIGQIMDIKTIAEFVESDAILAQLKVVGVDYGQGYGISKPQPLESLLANAGKPLVKLAG
jgi:diguanylate cyclase (GGDEF)-like protein/PAS domain S-box-containing protein